MAWLMANADLISGFFGLIAATAFGWPAFKAVRAKTYWERHHQLSRKEGLSAENIKQLARLAGRVDSLQLAGSREARMCNLIGASFLALAFVMLILAGVERRSGADAPKTTVQRLPAPDHAA